MQGSAEKQAFLLQPFDAEFGTDTGRLDSRGRPPRRARQKNIYNTAYYATPPSLFQQALARLEVDFERFTFVDLGAGKGRMILLASNFPFRQMMASSMRVSWQRWQAS